jgi:hypothetical protein
MSDEPVKTQKQDGPGKPEFTDEQYQAWLSELRPYLEKGNTIYYACEKAGIGSHYDVILRKYKLNDWLSQKVDIYRSRPGELVNDTIATLCYQVMDNIKKSLAVTKDDLDLLKFMAEKHRTSQPFFVNRTETAKADEGKIGKILDTIEETDYGDVGREAKKQMVAANPSIQNQGQGGAVNNIQAELPPTQTPSGTVQP